MTRDPMAAALSRDATETGGDAAARRHWRRREFLGAMSAAGLAALAGNEPRRLHGAEVAQPTSQPEPRADTMILIWLAGGLAAPETFDPKRYTPYEIGTPSNQILCTFPAIPTALDGVQISEGLEHTASVLDRGTLIRSHVVADLGSILHSRHQYHWHTGYVPPQTVAAPHIGAWIARLRGPRNPAIPAFINIGQRLEGHGESEELKAFTTAGFFGSEFGPFNIPFPNDAVSAVRPPRGVTRERFANREKAYRRLVNEGPLADMASDYHRQSVVRSMDNAYRLLNSPERKAFDLSLEPREVLDQYNVSRFGRGCLLARRLAEAGARYIEVTTEYSPFLYWDTHENGHSTYVEMKKQIDRPLARLVLDLEERGMLERTLVVVASEFSRDMMIEGVPGSTATDQSRAKSDVVKAPIHYGLHRHFTGSGSALIFGGGFKRGHVYGATAPERPLVVTKNPISIPDLHATLFWAMGIDPRTAFEVEKRPFHVTQDGKGQVVPALFAHA